MNYWQRTAIGLALVVLAGCGSEPSSVRTSIAGGGTVQVRRSRGKIAPAENDRYTVTTTELGAIILDGQRYLRWSFAIRLKQPIRLRSVRVEDVTGATQTPYIADQAPQVNGGVWTGYSGAIEPDAAAVPWLYDKTTSTRIFRITITDLNNQVSILNQGVSYSPSAKKELLQSYGLESGG